MLRWEGQAFLTAEVDGKPAGFIGCVRFDDQYAMIGFYIVLCEFRGKGVGRFLQIHFLVFKVCDVSSWEIYK